MTDQARTTERSPLAEAYYGWVRRVQRITSSGNFLPEIDGLRFLAIGAVFLHHVFTFVSGRARVSLDAALAPDLVGQIVNAGSYGVQLFFIISGFILGLPFAGQYLKGGPPVRLRAYFLRRLTRLEPPYLIVMALCFALQVGVWHESAEALWPHFLASAAYLHNAVYGTFSQVNTVAWSLEIEVQFYLVAPLLAYLFAIPHRRRRRLAQLAVIGVVMALQSAFLHDGSRLYFSLVGFGHFFLTGFLLADVYLTEWRDAPVTGRRYDWLFVGGAALAAVLAATTQRGTVAYPRWLAHLLALLVLTVPVVAAFRSDRCRRLLSASFVVSVGGMCYSIYLLHLPLMQLVGRATRTLVVTQSLAVNLVVHAAVFAVPVLVVSTAFYLAVERPCMRKDWPQRLARRLRGARPEGAAALPECREGMVS